jgi:hypothetical protein
MAGCGEAKVKEIISGVIQKNSAKVNKKPTCTVLN